ncbi:MAG: D-aminoacyl-tRNA deacylase [Salinivirgaceae bacterium]|jgi:D-tyrosyl-tRNA(Tyr) deacylase|nr:D-aminoacyl-tRNA deacylase [Salinivirgaceae bacterium]
MRLVIQRSGKAQVAVNNEIVGAIEKGLLVLAGIEDADTEEDAQWLVKKLIGLRVFDDADGVMNLSVKDIDGEILAVSQFTLHAKTKKGNRPSYIRAAQPEKAEELFNFFVTQLSESLNKPVPTGRFGQHMEVTLTNDGPVTILMDTKNKE